MDDRKNITLTTKDQTGLFKMLEGINRTNVFSQRNFFSQISSLHEKGWEIFETHRQEYLKSQRPKSLLFGPKISAEILAEANEFAMKQMQSFFEGFKSMKEDLLNAMIRISIESSSEFLSSVKGALTENGNDQGHLQGPGEEMGQLQKEGVFTRMTSK